MSPPELVHFLDSGEAESLALRTVIDHNLFTNYGRQAVTKKAVGESATVAGYIGLSTSATTASLALTALTDEIFRQAVSIRGSYNTYYQRYVAYYATNDFSSTGIAGASLMDTASTGGNGWAFASISVSKTSTQSLTVDWRVLTST